MKRHLFLLIIALMACLDASMARTVKILAIGNSFSEDAIEQNLHELAAADGISAVVGNLYIGGCSLEHHMQCVNDNKPEYRYRKIDANGQMRETPHCTVEQGLADDDWDYVSIQQASHFSGLYNTYQPYLEQLVAYIRQHTKKGVKIVFHQTWAYAQNATHSGFKNYAGSQQQMFQAIVAATKHVVKDIHPDVVVPAGTAIQNARTSALGDNLTRDGYHLNLLYGRYTAACTWYEAIFRRTVVGNSYAPQGISPKQKDIAQRAAHAAVKHRYKVTLL